MSSTKTSMPPAVTAVPLPAATPQAPQPAALDSGLVFHERSFAGTHGQPDAFSFGGLDARSPNPFGLPTAPAGGMGGGAAGRTARAEPARRRDLRAAGGTDDLSAKLSRALIILAAILAMLLLADFAQAQGAASPVMSEPTTAGLTAAEGCGISRPAAAASQEQRARAHDGVPAARMD